MKICILNSRHTVRDTRVKRITETLSEAGHEVTIIAPSTGEVDLDVFDEKLNITFIGMDRQAQGDFEQGKKIGGLFRTLISRAQISFELFRIGLGTKADVYHCNEMDSWLVGIFFKCFGRKKVVFDVHEYYPARIAEAAAKQSVSAFLERAARRFVQFFSRFTDGLIFINGSLTNLYQFHCRHVVLRNCVRLGDFRPLVEDAGLRATFQDRTIVVHIGSLREGYGDVVLLESLAFITDPKTLFLILGGAPEGFLEEVERRGVGDKIRVIKQLPFEEMLAYLSLAEIGITLLQPRDKNMIYSLGRKFLEYIAAGIPVLAPDFPEYRSIIDRYQLGLVMDPEDPQEIAATVTRLVKDRELRQQLGDNAARAFEGELNWELESGKLMELYAGL